MANQWLRLWHDMPNDPKWRTIARVSKQSIGNVMAVYLHLLVNAANANERGRTQNVCSEDLATALDIETDQVEAILAAMQFRVLDGDLMTGWAKRQPEREDGAAERAKAWREAKKEALRTQPNATERDRTQDKEEIREEEKVILVPSDAGDARPIVIAKPDKPDCPHQKIIDLYHLILPMCPQVRDWTPARAKQLKARWDEDPRRQNLDYWKRFFEYVADCDFLVGKSQGKPFFADLEWMTKQANFTKIREERYANRI